MPHHVGNTEVKIVTRKVFEDFGSCDDQRAWEVACDEQANDSWVEVCVSKVHDDPDREHLRQWLLQNGACEEDGYVILGISW